MSETRVAIVTSASGSIGSSVAREFAARGYALAYAEAAVRQAVEK